jgi:hypothetical protein
VRFSHSEHQAFSRVKSFEADILSSIILTYVSAYMETSLSAEKLQAQGLPQILPTSKPQSIVGMVLSIYTGPRSRGQVAGPK